MARRAQPRVARPARGESIRGRISRVADRARAASGDRRVLAGFALAVIAATIVVVAIQRPTGAVEEPATAAPLAEHELARLARVPDPLRTHGHDVLDAVTAAREALTETRLPIGRLPCARHALPSSAGASSYLRARALGVRRAAAGDQALSIATCRASSPSSTRRPSRGQRSGSCRRGLIRARTR